jgi:hypothetical protein
MHNGGSGPELSDRALLTSVEMDSSAQNTVELEQIISSLDAGYTGEDSQEINKPLWYKDVFLIDEEGIMSSRYPRTCTMFSWAPEQRRS